MEHEFGGADLGDQRLNARLVDSARTLDAMPGGVMGYYPTIDKPDDSAVTPQAILALHAPTPRCPPRLIVEQPSRSVGESQLYA